ncbi:MAG: LytTR family DNA-binding domain-containing protein [Chitinophagaceae bacterium]
MLTAIILEDEEDNRKLLTGFLRDYCPQIHLLAAVDTVDQAFAAINSFQPDVVFMDIQLKGETSFELLEKFSEIKFEIIFTTAYDSYMLNAIKLSAIDYLLKPINVAELKIAIEKAEKKRVQLMMNKNLEILLSNFRNNTADHQIAITSSDGFVFVKVSNIIYLEAESAYTVFFLKDNQKITTSKNLKLYEELLADHGFFRIHKSYMINMAEIAKYVRGDGGYLIMSNKATIEVSRRRKDEFLELFNKPLK